MIEIVIVASSTTKFQALLDGLESFPGIRVAWAKSSAETLKLASAATPGIMIIDEQVDGKSGLDLARDVILVNAGINMAVVSGRSADDFHAAGEGLGILAQLPPNPGIAEAEHLFNLIEKL